MNDTTLGAAKVPWHLWLIGGLSLLFNAMGVISYTMTKFDMLAEAGMTADQIAFMNAYPAWASAFWALGVWGAFAGSVLLLLRSRFAVPAMVAATIGLVGTTVYNYGLIEVPAAMEAPALDIAIWAVTLSLLLYVRRMAAAGVLK
ncbi:hypothetical protein GVM20_01480 [Porphyrobacter sp. SLTP]|uniref:hypothetical protein n=1 Tax=Porphyrobacter sp. SLTP TaxID=2683266 RepID=UPI0014134E22|nr:hypothetical protein [Porphyrobacter sp. SLTP]NBB23795.1 hypothetical protein [Porphyrobacter sp. SLTP]